MRVMYEQWFVKYKVDIIFAGHVHAYERSVSADSPYYNGTQCFQMTEKKNGFLNSVTLKSNMFALQERISNIAYNIVNGLCSPISDESAPVYITIGDGGNLEGLVTE